MKHLEDLSRMHVEEAIQAGLKEQTIHRALSEPKELARPASRERVRWFNTQLSNWPSRIILMMNTFLKFVG
jgi:hypothetical protein